jgi:hypothetical protein
MKLEINHLSLILLIIFFKNAFLKAENGYVIYKRIDNITSYNNILTIIKIFFLVKFQLIQTQFKIIRLRLTKN